MIAVLFGVFCDQREEVLLDSRLMMWQLADRVSLSLSLEVRAVARAIVEKVQVREGFRDHSVS